MKHITEEQFVSYLYQEMPQDAKLMVENHLNGCPECRALLEGLQNTIVAVDSLPDYCPEGALERLSSQFEAKTATKSDIMTPEELAEMLKVPLSTIYELLTDLPYLNLAGQIRFRRDSINHWLELREHNSHRDAKIVYEDMSVRLWRDAI
ncbi:MAG: helix-turn-helix domain-containing protein [Candidatus Wallbacteria bacterium]|nr:helix-turn-helix domain-containing protein [Candidatus Wallbacteria bacterium]